MEVPIDLYKRMAEADLALVPAKGQVKNSDSGNDRVILPKTHQVPMDSGFIAAKYLIKIEEVRPYVH